MIMTDHDYRTSRIAANLRLLLMKMKLLNPDLRTQVELLVRWTADWYLKGMRVGFIIGLFVGGLATLAIARL